jgi:tetratricopeptide (TPR) repeat protein
MTTNAAQAPVPVRRRRWKKPLLVVGLMFVLLLGSLAVLEGVTGILRALAAVDRGDRMLNDKQFEEAAAAYSRAIELRPSSARAYHGRAIARFELKDYDGAVTDAARADVLEPYNRDYRRTVAIIYGRRATVRINAGDFDGGMEDYEEAHKLNPDDPTPRHNAAVALHDRGCVRLNGGDLGGVDDIVRAYKLVPEDAERTKMDRDYVIALTRRGHVRLDGGDLDGAIDDLTAAAGVRPVSASLCDQAADALCRRSRARVGQGQADAALADYDQAVALYPDPPKEADPKPRYPKRSGGTLLDLALMPIGRLLEVHVQPMPSVRARTYFDRGTLRDKRNDLAGAAADYAQAIALFEEFAEAYEALCLVRLRQGDQAEADALKASYARLRGAKEAAALQRKMDAILYPNRL